MNKITNKKGFALLLSAILVISMIAAIASASDWPEFQKDEVNTGRTGDSAPTDYWNETVLWNHHTAHADYSGIDTVPLVVGNYVYVLAADANYAYLYKYYKNGSSAGWTNDRSVALGSGGYQNSVPAYGEGKIFVLNSDDGYLYAVNADTGELSGDWTTNPVSVTVRQLSCPITYYNDSNAGRLFFGDCEGGTRYYCYYADNGTKAWEYVQAGENYWAGAVVIGDYIVFGNDAGKLQSLYWSNGTKADSLVLSTLVANNRQIRSSIVWKSVNETYGYIFFTDKKPVPSAAPGSSLVWKIGFNKTTGDIVESDYANSSNMYYTVSTPVVYNGRVYVGAGNFTTKEKRWFYCLYESNLSEVWHFGANGAIYSSPALSIQDTDVYIYFTTNDKYGTCYCLKDGGSSWEEKWTYTTEQAGTNGGYILQGVASDGYVYFGNDGGYLYGINKVEHVYDFCTGAGGEDGAEMKWAYGNQTDGNPPTACNDPNNEFSTSEYDKIKVDDGEFQSDVTTGTASNYAAHRFNFTILESAADISKINVTWNGKGWHDSEGADNGTYLYIYNFSATSAPYYDELANNNGVGTDATLTGEVTSGISNYINSGNVTVLVKQKSPQTYNEDEEKYYRSHIATDYVKVLVHTKP
jgi:outer membrane protein assembly factor BamB